MTPALPRLVVLDWLRTLAIVAMVVFHFGRDLEVLGLVPPGTTFGGLWDLSARTIASTFLFLAGLSLWLGHGAALRWRPYLKRLGLLVVAAAGISLVTYFAVPGAWVRFGILHSIAACSVIGLLFLRLPWVATLAGAGATLWLARIEDPAFDGAVWIWSGLSARVPPMIDYEPLAPWLAPFLLGLAFGQMGGARLLRGGSEAPGPWARRLAWPGRHALAIYLIHQPLLVGLLSAAAWIWYRGL